MTKTSNYCISLSDFCQDDKLIIGNKGYSIFELKNLGCSVPDCFFITVNAFNRFIKINDIEVGGYRDHIDYNIDDNIKNEIKIHFELLKKNNLGSSKFAVRSSSICEDSKDYSFAGLYDTILNVKNLNELYIAINSVWKSFYNYDAVKYRKKAGAIDSMGIVVQCMIDCEWGGVLFSKSPYKSTEMMIEFVKGHPEKLVNGDVKADLLLVDRKRLHFNLIKNTISKTLINKLINDALLIERTFSIPIDIEWCIDKLGKLWILQTRPISNSIFNNIDLENGVLVHKEQFSILGCEIAIDSHHKWLEAMMKLHHRTYPISIVERNGFLIDEAPFPRKYSNLILRLWEKMWRAITFLNGAVVHENYVRKNIFVYERDIEKLDFINVNNNDKTKLIDGFNKSINLYLNLQKDSFSASTLAVVSAKLLDIICKYFSTYENKFSSQILLSGLNNKTVDGLKAQYKFFNKNRNNNIIDLIKNFDNNNYNNEEEFLSNYLYLFADRYPRDPAWKVNYDTIKNSLNHWENSENNISKYKDMTITSGIEKEKLYDHLDGLYLGKIYRTFFDFVLKKAMTYYPEKENKNHYVYRAIMLIRKYVKSLGKLAKEMKFLEDENDIFFLRRKEINDMLSDNIKINIINDIVRNRKDNYYRSKIYSAKNKIKSETFNNRNYSEFHGFPLSPGKVIGRACIISDFSDLSKVKSGDIVICSNPRPAWSSAFARSSGVIILSGGILSHGSILVRELGIPAIINPNNYDGQINDGAKISLNGTDGIISIL